MSYSFSNIWDLILIGQGSVVAPLSQPDKQVVPTSVKKSAMFRVVYRTTWRARLREKSPTGVTLSFGICFFLTQPHLCSPCVQIKAFAFGLENVGDWGSAYRLWMQKHPLCIKEGFASWQVKGTDCFWIWRLGCATNCRYVLCWTMWQNINLCAFIVNVFSHGLPLLKSVIPCKLTLSLSCAP